MQHEWELSQALERVHFPATKSELLNEAYAEFAPAEVIHLLDELPEEDYLSFDAVRETLLRIS